MRLKNKLTSFSLSLIVVIAISILFLAVVFWMFFQYSGSNLAGKDGLSTLGGYFGGITTLGATVVAGYLFNDWKEQHNKEIEIQFISKVMESFNLFDLKITRMFQFDYPTIDIALRHDVFIRECLILELDVRIIQVRYADYISYLGQEMPELHKEIFVTLRKSINQLKRTDDIIRKRDLIKHQVNHDLFEFTSQYDKIIHPTLLQNLKALT